MKTKNVIPFSNGTEADIWQSRNCFRCKYYESKSVNIEDAKCDLAFYLDLARGIGTIPLSIAQRIGCEDEQNGFVKLYSTCRGKTGYKPTPEQRERYNLHRRAKRAGFTGLNARKRTFFTSKPVDELPEAVKILMNQYGYVIQMEIG